MNKTMSIRTKMIVMILPIMLLVIVAFFALSRNTIIKLSKQELEAESTAYTENISSWVNQILGEITIYRDAINENRFADDKEILEFMKSSVDKNDAYPIGLYMGDDSGIYLDASGWVPGDDWVLTERDWYVQGKESKEITFGEPYYDSQSGQVCVSAACLMDYAKATRVLAVDVYLDYVAELMTNISIGDTGRAFLVTKNSETILAHPDKDMLDVKLSADGNDGLYKQIGKALQADKTGLLEVKGDKGDYYACVNPIDNTDWCLITYISRKDVLSDLRRLEIFMGMIAFVAAVLMIFFSLRIMNRVVKPVESVTDVLIDVAKGNFTREIEVKGHDEIAQMGGNMKMFLSRMREVITDIANTAEWLKRQSEENGRVSDSLLDSSKSQAEAMAVMESMITELSETTEQVAQQMEQLAHVIHTTREEGAYAGTMMNQTVEASENGKNAMEDIREGMDAMAATITSLAEQIKETEGATAKIGDMVNMIVEIADETELLSLNASIEAARAGEAGAGFAVVAEQIGKLAANSAEAADDIARLTVQIKDTVLKATSHMEHSVLEVEDSTKKIGEASTTFETVFDKVGETEKTVECMIQLIGQVDDVAKRMEQIAMVQVNATEQITESSVKLGELTKEVTTDSDTVAANAVELEKESGKLMERIEQFQV